MELSNDIKHKKAKTHKGRKFLENRLPKVHEGPKLSLFINTANSNEILRMILNDLVRLKFNLLAYYETRPFKETF
jgi:hypothetical protein